MMMSKTKQRKMKRYHKMLYFPPWAGKSLQAFTEGVHAHGSITLSLHASEKAWEYATEYGRKLLKFLSKVIREDVTKNGNVFEFYATGEEIRKVCFRVSSTGSPVDLVLVISADSVLVTVFITNKGDNHTSLDESLYERKE